MLIENNKNDIDLRNYELSIILLDGVIIALSALRVILKLKIDKIC